jgi:hypothetical protein
MEMNHYKDSSGNLYGFPADGSQDHLKPAGLIGIGTDELKQQSALNFEKTRKEEIAKMDYVGQRLSAYPNLGEFVDAWVKNDQEALEEYREKCLAVKVKYPKPAGV